MHLPHPPTSRAADRPAGGATPTADTEVVLAYARMLQREALGGSRQPWLRGKNVGFLSGAGAGAEETLFCQAAAELGAKVARISPFPEQVPATPDLQLTARLIGRLYDAVDWPNAPTELLPRVRSAAGIPIYDGLATARHPSARLAGLLDAESSLADRRRFIVQAMLIATII